MNAFVDLQNQRAVDLNKKVFCLSTIWNQAMNSSQRRLTIKQFRLMKNMNGKVLFPFHNNDYGGHWILGVLDLEKREAFMVDSYVHEEHDYMADCQSMIDFFLETLDEPYEVITFYMKGLLKSVQQVDDYNCGIFVLLFIKYFVEGKRIPKSFSKPFLKQKRMEFHRDVTLEFGFPTPKGIKNLGNTCFMNPVFQMLCTSTLWRYILKTNSTQDKPLTRLLLEFQENMGKGGLTHQSPLNPVDIYQQIQNALPAFGNGKTHDCHEFMEALFNHLAFETEDLDIMYTGTFFETTKCGGCTDLGYEPRESYPDFISLQVEIPDKPKSFIHCLDRYFEEETVKDGHCDDCNPTKNQNIPMPPKKRKHQILTPPSELIIQLKRFNNRLSKKADILVPPTILNIEKYCSDVRPEDHNYKLFGVVVHKKNHYTAYFKTLDPEATNNKRTTWFFFDDAKLPVQVHPDFLNTVEAYICFYEKIETINIQSEESTNEDENRSDPTERKKDPQEPTNKKRKSTGQEPQHSSKRGRYIPEPRPEGGKVVLDWADFDVEAKNYNLIITARELWLAAKDTSKYKYNKNLKPRIEDIPKMVLKRFTTESIHKEVGECSCKMERCEKSKFKTEDIIKERRAFFFSKDKDEYLKNKISSLYSERNKNITYRLAGRELCQEAFYLLIGSSYYTVGKLAKECTNSGGHILTKVCSPSAFVLIS